MTPLKRGGICHIDHWQVTPDIITTAKGISGGYSPLAAAILRQEMWQALASGSQKVMHSYTFGGNPLSCAVGLTVLNYIDDHHLVARSRQMGDKLLGALQREMGDLPWVGQVRGVGLLIGVVAISRSCCRAAGV